MNEDPRSRRGTFDQAADLYDDARPTYVSTLYVAHRR
jgi:hypothetical protein